MDIFFCDGLISILINGVILPHEGTCLMHYTARSLGSPTEIIQLVMQSPCNSSNQTIVKSQDVLYIIEVG